MSDNFVSIQNLTKDYGSFRALNAVSFDIKQGEIFGYIGPNGAGKTTTMKILVGLIQPSYGKALINGYDASKRNLETYKLLGYMPQNVAFQEWRTVNQVLRTFGKLSNLTESKIEERIPEILKLLSLVEVRYKKISQLSGGMIQKVGLAQALLHEPKLLVLDEPLGGLDPLSRYQFKEIIRKIASQGTTILFSTHVLSDVQDVADRIGIINRGKILQVGTLADLKASLSPQKTIDIELSQETDKWKNLKQVDGIATLEQPSTRKILIQLKDDSNEDQVINNMVKKIVELGIHIRGIAVLQPSIDEVYLKYVQEAENS
jgi:ABC-2 type transport system ATP-binding protein